MGQLRYKDPLTGLWEDIYTTGPIGPRGPQGIDGPQGLPGQDSEDVWVGPDAPTSPLVDLWYDTDDTRLLGPVDLPVGGAFGQPLMKASDVDGDVQWGGQPIRFESIEGNKILAYPGAADGVNSFGMGVAASTLSLFAGPGGNVSFREGGHSGTRWGYVNSGGFVFGSTKLQGQILQNGGFQGPWDGEGTAAWTVNLTAGSYIFFFSATGTSTSVAARTIDLKVDGTIEATARIWINTVNAHAAFNLGIGSGSYSAGNHTITIHNGGGTSSDVNDYASVLCIPAW